MSQEKIIKIKVEAENAIEEINDLQQGVKGTSQAAVDSKSSFIKMKDGVSAVALAFKAMGIGLIVGALIQLKDMMMQNQVVMDSVAIAGETINAVFQKVIDLAVKVGQSMTSG